MEILVSLTITIISKVAADLIVYFIKKKLNKDQQG